MVKKTNEHFLKEVYELVKNEYTFLEKYEKAHKQIKVKHNVCDFEYYVKPTNFLQGNRCPVCSGNFKNAEIFKKEVKELVGDEYSVLEDYKRKRHKILFKHNKCGTVFKKYPETFLIGQRCPKCGLERRSKENHYRYNPQLTDEQRKSRDFYNDEISKWRKKIYARDGYICKNCNGKNLKLNAHHLYSWDLNEDKRFSLDNGVTLCEECHRNFHKKYGYGNNTLEQYLEFNKNSIK